MWIRSTKRAFVGRTRLLAVVGLFVGVGLLAVDAQARAGSGGVTAKEENAQRRERYQLGMARYNWRRQGFGGHLERRIAKPVEELTPSQVAIHAALAATPELQKQLRFELGESLAHQRSTGTAGKELARLRKRVGRVKRAGTRIAAHLDLVERAWNSDRLETRRDFEVARRAREDLARLSPEEAFYVLWEGIYRRAQALEKGGRGVYADDLAEALKSYTVAYGPDKVTVAARDVLARAVRDLATQTKAVIAAYEEGKGATELLAAYRKSAANTAGLVAVLRAADGLTVLSSRRLLPPDFKDYEGGPISLDRIEWLARRHDVLKELLERRDGPDAWRGGRSYAASLRQALSEVEDYFQQPAHLPPAAPAMNP